MFGSRSRLRVSVRFVVADVFDRFGIVNGYGVVVVGVQNLEMEHNRRT